MYKDYEELLEKIKQVDSILSIGFTIIQTKEDFDKGIIDLISNYDDNRNLAVSVFGEDLMTEIIEYYDSL